MIYLLVDILFYNIKYFLLQPNQETLVSKIDKFVINQNTLANVNDNCNIPKFHIIGIIDSVICSITQPFLGEVSYIVQYLFIFR